MNARSAIGVPTPGRTMNTNERLARLVGAPPNHPGTARLGCAVQQFSPEQALAALGAATEYQLRVKAGELGRIKSIAYHSGDPTFFGKHGEWQQACKYAEAASLLSKSEDARLNLLAFAKTVRMDAFTQTADLVARWVDAGRPQRVTCPECNGETVQIDAEREDAASGLGAADAGPICTNCDWDGRTRHPLTSRGSNSPFLG